MIGSKNAENYNKWRMKSKTDQIKLRKLMRNQIKGLLPLVLCQKLNNFIFGMQNSGGKLRMGDR
jgi:hypothetical protein